ncbi:hypothetical protein F5Y12DRAFT_719981 [Xylaria sp. FL1777]|nr:hypothetical protein F5Y12DRAFT_719981 [Xylaria sp. FL1777]
MPAYRPTDEFTCGHTQETIHRPLRAAYQGTKSQVPDAQVTNNEATGSQGPGTDTRVVNEMPSIPTRCLVCVCHSVLEASYESTHAIPRSYLRELNEHVRVLSLSASKVMQHELRLLGEQVRCLDDVDEFRKGVIALAGYVETMDICLAVFMFATGIKLSQPRDATRRDFNK